jgi:hypothetical protein
MSTLAPKTCQPPLAPIPKYMSGIAQIAVDEDTAARVDNCFCIVRHLKKSK